MKRNRRDNEFTEACQFLAFGAIFLGGCGGNDNAIRRSDVLGGTAGSSAFQYSSAATITRTSSVQQYGGASSLYSRGGGAACSCSAEPQCQCPSTTEQNQQSIASGGAIAAGGTTNTGGSTTNTGGSTTNTGGSVASGGVITSGGTNTGGSVASGGVITSGGTNTGGSVAAGGVITSGGTNTGGSAAGGVITSGGTNTGGVIASGGTSSPSTGLGGTSTTPTAPLCSPACAGGNASWECMEGSCKVLACDSGYRDCDGAILGCETNIQSSVDHCGSCTTVCSGGNAEWSCQQGKCVATACAAGWADCSASAPGCETSAARNPSHCGRCNNACSLLVCRDGDCLDHKVRYGNTGPGLGYFNVGKNYLIGERIKVEVPSVLIGFGIALSASALNVPAYAGVYEDALNTPGKLLAGGQSSLAMGAGGAEFEVAQVDLLPGNYYWLLVVTNETAMYAYNNPTTKSGNTRYISYAYQALPTSAPATMDIPNIPDPNFYLIVAL